MYKFIENVIRGGVSYIAQKHSKANCKYMKSYDRDKPSKYIIYEDVNNLCEWVTFQSSYR